MINEESIKLYSILAKLAYFSGFSPILWSNRHLTVPKLKLDSWRAIQVSLVFIMAHLYEFFIIFMIAFGVIRSKSSLNEVTLAFAYFMVVLLTIVMLYNVFYNSEDAACHINSFLHFWGHFRDNYLICEGNRISYCLNQCLKLGIALTFAFSFLLGVYTFEYPKDKMFLTGHISGPIVFRILHPIVVALHMYFSFGSCAVMLLAFFTALIPAALAYTLGKEIMPKKHPFQDYCTTSDLRKPNKIINVYKTFYIFNIFANEFLAPIALPMQAIVSWAIVICNFGLVNLHRHLNFKAIGIVSLISATFTVGWFSSLWFAGLSYKMSQGKIAKLRSLTDWPKCNSSVEKKYYKKALRGLAPFHLKVGNFYVVEIQKAMNFISFIFWGTAKFLIMWK